MDVASTQPASFVSSKVPGARASTRATAVVWAFCSVNVALLIPVLVLAFLNRHAPDIWSIAGPSPLIGAVAYTVVGALLGIHRPHNLLGWLFLVTGTSTLLSGLATHWGFYGLVTQPGTSGSLYSLWIGFWIAAWFPWLLLPILLYPGGRLPDRRTRVVALLTVVSGTLLVVGLMSGSVVPPGFPDIYLRYPNPLVEPDTTPIIDPGLCIMALGLCALLAIGLLLARFRRSRGVERQQYKWIVFTMAAYVALFVADFFARASGTGLYVVTSPAMEIAVALVPVLIGVAILRHHLYDIDLIINRSLVYIALSLCVVGFYIFIVGWLGTVFRTGGNLGFSLLATGVVAVVFQPLRERIQRSVNRLLYGERDEPYAVLARLGQRLESTLAVDAVLPAIAGTIQEALKLPYAAVALQHSGGQYLAAASGTPTVNPLRLPLVYQHEPVGELLLAPRTPGEPFSPADQRLLADLTRQAGIAVHSVQLTYELQQARERLVAAREEERRRLRRDLHDGLGSQLAALNLQAGGLRSLIDNDPEAAQAEVVELRAQLRDAIASIRTLVHGLRPPAVDELGLRTALTERTRQYSADGLNITAELPETLPELPAAVEVAIYRIVEEALTNVAKHAHARNCRVRLTLNGAVELSIEDDGDGITPEATGGVGLGSMRERAEELGGTCVISPSETGGTVVAVRLPRQQGHVDVI